jgi:predicted permease
MANIILLFGCLIAGMLLRLGRRMPDNAHTALNGFIIHLSLPALILGQLHGVRLASDLLLPVLMPWLLFGLSAAVFSLTARTLRFSASATGALIMTAGLANTSFVGLPMIEAFYGGQDLSTGILIDQLGSYLVLSTFGIVVACMFSAGAVSGREIARRIVTFPPLIALVLAFLLMPVTYPPWAVSLLHRLGDTLAPMALVSVGLQLRLDQVAGHGVALGVGLGFKLVLGPLLIALIYVVLLSGSGETTRVTVFESAMGPMIGGSIVAIQYGLSPPLTTLMVGIGIALSFVTLPLWYLGLASL